MTRLRFKLIRMKYLLFVAFLTLTVTATSSFASGNSSLYLRLGAGAALSEDTTFKDADCNSTSPAAFFGCGDGNDGRKLGAYGDYGSSALVNLAVGYEWNSWLRTEASFSYRPDLQFNGDGNFRGISTDFKQTATADIQNYSGMIVGVVKPVAIFSKKKLVIDPLLSAGIGFSYNRIDSITYLFPKTSTITPEGGNTSFAWSVGAGMGYEFSERIGVELMYNYIDLGTIAKDSDTMTVIRRSDNSVITDSIVVGETEAELQCHEIVLSLVVNF